MKRFLPEIAVLCALLSVVRYGFAQAWVKTGAGSVAARFPSEFISESFDGRVILVAGSGAILSTNWGVSWTGVSTNAFSSPGMSADGRIMIIETTSLINFVYSNNIAITTNTGATWTTTILPSTNWAACVSSADGRVLAAACGDGYIYTSTNTGTGWRTNTTVQNWHSLAASAEGTRLVAVPTYQPVWLSTNSGSTWQTSGSAGAWVGAASSSDGMHLAVISSTNTEVSTNGGLTWQLLNQAGQGVALSPDGNRLMLAKGNTLSISTNFGGTWSSTNISGIGFYSINSSADGCEMFAGESYGLWEWQVPPCPILNLTARTNNLNISWLVPCTNLVLQQCADIGASNWLSLTNIPVLNLTNSEDQLTLPVAGIGAFYRMAVP